MNIALVFSSACCDIRVTEVTAVVTLLSPSLLPSHLFTLHSVFL